MVALMGSLSAFVFNWLHWKITSKKEGIDAISRSLITAIEGINDYAVDYWLKETSTRDETGKMMEIRIKSYFRQVNSYFDIFDDLIDDKKFGSEKMKIKKLFDEIYDCSTGGGFESERKQPDPSVAAKISSKCSMMIAKVSSVIYFA